MFKSIQWKLVIISFLLVWLAMSIVGVYITQAIKSEQINTSTRDIEARANNLANTLKDKMVGAPNIEDVVLNWFMGQGQQVKSVHVFQKNAYVAGQDNTAVTKEDKTVNYMIETTVQQVFEQKATVIRDSEDGNKYSKSIGVPIISSTNDMVGAIYVRADLSGVEKNIENINNILTSATILVLCITVFLGSLLARTITGPIKEVTSKAEKLAKGDFGQVVSVKSNDEVGQLTEMFNYLTVKLKGTLDEISREKNKVESILTHMTDGIIAVDKNGIILHTNPAALKMLGIKGEDIDNKSFNDIAKAVNMGITCEELFEDSEDRHNILSANHLIVKLNVVLFKNENRETAGAIIVLQDVTEQERLDKMRKEFVANVSHELRTPLTTIKSYTETLLDGAMESKEYTVNFLKVIDSESERMTRLVKDLLQLSRLDYDKVQWNMKKINVVSIVDDCIYKMNINAKQKNQTLCMAEIQEDTPHILGDKDRIEQVMVNIISNAIKYTPEGGKIQISVQWDEKYVSVKVADNGIGIPKEDIPRLCERFYRVDKARSRMMGGTGLGLSIAKQIVEAHNGFIHIESEYGQGTEVLINLPYEQETVDK